MFVSHPIVIAAVMALYLPVPFIMIWLHALYPVWRRWGKASYVVHAPLYAAMVSAILAARDVWAAGAWGFPSPMRAIGVLLIAASIAVLVATYRHLDTATLTAFRQVAGAGRVPLVTSGVYARVRHPRYTILITGALGNFLLSGYPWVLASVAVVAVLVPPLVWLEERDLVAYYGEAYARYRARTPSLIPRPRR